MKSVRPEVVRHGSLLSRIAHWFANVLSGRRLIPCSRCHASGTEFSQRTDASGLISIGQTCCTKCQGDGALWE